MSKQKQKSFLIVAMLFMSNYALAVPVGGSKEEDNFILFSLLAFPVIVVWFSINAAVALIEKRSNLGSLYFSSALLLFYGFSYLSAPENSLNEDPNSFFIVVGIILVILLVNIIAIKKLRKRQQEKEIE